MRTPFLLGLFLAASSASAANIVWLETERFDGLGGWVNDSQFIDLMGSPYLLAAGMGKPVADAVTRVTLPAPGKYRLWARTKDWMPENHPGAFQILFDGRPIEPTFGRSGKAGWHWEDGGVHESSAPVAGTRRVPSAAVELRLHDLSGYYGRCDAILLTDDLSFTPPEGKDAIALLRQQHGGVSRNVKLMPEHDVVVIGGGLAGCTAAVAAARGGASVALIQNRPMLGGNASPEILVPPVGVWPHGKEKPGPLDPRETGLVEEYRTAGNQTVEEGKLYAKRLMRFVRLEPNLDLYLNTHATGAEMKPGAKDAIAAVPAVDVRSGERMRFPGRLFIDCTGDAVVGVAAGAEFRHGKEPKSMYDEPFAPDAANTNTMGNSLKYYSRDLGAPQPFAAPPWAYPFPACESFQPGRHPRLGGEIGWQWMIELGGLRDTYADAEEIRDDLLRLIYGIWDHVKNHCPKCEKAAAGHALVWVAHVAGKRESRRLIGDYVLTQNDIGRQTLFPDRVAYGGWVVDDHYSGGFFHQGLAGVHYDKPEHAYMGLPYSIPFRCLYSKNVGNLMMAGRNISASHLALANTRVMLTCAVIGHAAGTAAGMCIRENTSPRGLYEKHLADLQQQLVKEGAYLIDLAADDPRDLARKAAITASSESRGVARAAGQPAAQDDGVAGSVVNGFARAVGGRSNAWQPAKDAAPPHWIELAWPKPIELNVVHVTFQTADLATRRFAVEAWQEGVWHRVADVPDNRHRRHVLGLDAIATAKLRVVLDQPCGICEIRVYNEPQRQVEIARRAHRNMRLPDEGPWFPWE